MRWKILIPLGIASLSIAEGFALPEKAIAHGVNIQHHEISAIQIQASYDSGEPMDNAQVTIYAPDDPATPWMQGVANDQGEFIFVPESGQTGTWTVRFRKAGHGQIVHIPNPDSSSHQGSTGETVHPHVSSNGESTGESSSAEPSQPAIASANLEGYTSMQKGLMIASVIWGCVGTALFFSRTHRSKSNARS